MKLKQIFPILLIFFLLFIPSAFIYPQTSLVTESFETDGDGSRYEANYFADACGNADWYRRASTSDCGSSGNPNDKLKFSISGIDGTYFMAGDDVEQSPENPLGSGEAAYVTLATLDVSSYDEITINVAVAANDELLFENDRAIVDAFFAQYAFDGNIATGANSAGSLPSQANLNTGAYTNAIAFYANNTSGSGNLQEDTDLNGSPDGTTLSTTLTTYSATFNTGGASNLSVRFVIRTDQGGEDVAFDDIEVIGDVTLPIVLSDFSGFTSANSLTLSWETHSEINAKGMMLEASYEGKAFQDLRWVPAKGLNGEGANYKAKINDLLMGDYQFRLRMEDWNGQVEWSKRLNFQIEAEKPWQVFQTPGKIHILQKSKQNPYKFQLYDLEGKLVLQKELFKETEILRIQELPSFGMYFFSISDRAGRTYRSSILIF